MSAGLTPIGILSLQHIKECYNIDCRSAFLAKIKEAFDKGKFQNNFGFLKQNLKTELCRYSGAVSLSIVKIQYN